MTSPINRACIRLVNVNPNDADAATTLADCRTAIAIARGRHLDDIHPSLGYDLSPEAYRTVRERWATEAARSKFGAWAAAQHDRARAFWQEHRLDLAADWPALNMTADHPGGPP